jgi:tetratricopeptide (TPR) repeat protein
MVSECIRKYENFEEAICFRGKIYMNMNFYHKAEQDFKLSINLSKASFLSYVGLADCYRFQGKVEKALTMYYKSLEILGQKDSQREINHKPEIQMKMAICLYQMEKYDQSQGILQELARHE